MSFWNNPENNSIKTILIVLVVIVLGYFAYRYVQTGSLGGSGRVINPGAVNTINPRTPAPAAADCDKANTFQTISGNCVFIDGSCLVHESDSGAHTGVCTGTEKSSAASVSGTGTSRGTLSAPTGTTAYPAAEKCQVQNTWSEPGHNCVHISSDCKLTPSDKCTPTPDTSQHLPETS